jgi:16S rRNA (guanine966-N2)-methyltransferase
MRIIAGTFRRRILTTPDGLDTRPTSGALRESVFNICMHAIDQSNFLDLFAGSGAMGLEAISRGAAAATFVENGREAVRCIHQNVEMLKVEQQCRILQGEVFRLVQKLSDQGKEYDIIFADPPYQSKDRKNPQTTPYSQMVLDLVDQLPILKSGGWLFIEESADFPLKIDSLQTLIPLSSRRFSSAQLHQFEKKAL